MESMLENQSIDLKATLAKKLTSKIRQVGFGVCVSLLTAECVHNKFYQ